MLNLAIKNFFNCYKILKNVVLGKYFLCMNLLYFYLIYSILLSNMKHILFKILCKYHHTTRHNYIVIRTIIFKNGVKYL
ncbi:unnamed protein product [Nezara viridula]|uniref:Uncharacterized protein n=1 Tax=Nezara viridula TaxID=85310 RepID=A0A9P0H5Y3_NEZVI|nr:unnamed protein product [Nezara viridula]